jgi:hypothetical protein
VLTAAPDRKGRLSDGFLVEASIRARVLGLPLLRLDANVVVMPADVAAPSYAPRATPARTAARSPSAPQTGPGTPGRGLAEAVRTINEGSEVLAEARRNGR